jgi:serine phosphatase RsbU (regulator of sigma subunit)
MAMRNFVLPVTAVFFVFIYRPVAAAVPDSLLLLVKTSPDSTRVGLYLELGNYYQNKETGKCLFYFEKALESAKKSRKRKLVARALMNLGGVYNGTGEYPRALKYFTQALEVFEILGDKSKISNTLNSIGNNYLGQGNREMAEKYYRQSMKFAKEANDEGMIAIASYGLAGMLFEKKKYTESVKAFDDAAVLFKKLNREFEYAAVRVTQASIFITIGNLPQAEKTIDEGILYMKKTGDKYGTSQALKQLAKIQTEKKNYTLANNTLLQALLLCRQIGARANIKEFYQLLANNYALLADKNSAYVYMEKYALLNDSLFNEENAKQTAEMQEKYQSAKKEKALVKQQAELKHERDLARHRNTQNKIYLVGLIAMFILSAVALRAYQNSKKARREIAMQKTIIEEKNKDITDSIRYAHQIQQSLLPLLDNVRSQVGDLFVYYEPKDIVSGDFYWAGQKNNKLFVAAADCTGHGVPGAFMSMLGFHALDNALKNENVNAPADLLYHLHLTIVETFRKKDRSQSVQDGMDVSIVSFDRQHNLLEFAAANNRVYIAGKNGLTEIKGDLFSIGNVNESRKLVNKQHTVYPGDTVYIFSDGFASQFGGERGKKMKYSRMKEILLKYVHLGMAEQQQHIHREMEIWRGPLEQIDDILVMGIRIG